jgi:hypothetical protein
MTGESQIDHYGKITVLIRNESHNLALPGHTQHDLLMRKSVRISYDLTLIKPCATLKKRCGEASAYFFLLVRPLRVHVAGDIIQVTRMSGPGFGSGVEIKLANSSNKTLMWASFRADGAVKRRKHH